jgi:hypothetical protein
MIAINDPNDTNADPMARILSLLPPQKMQVLDQIFRGLTYGSGFRETVFRQEL